MVVVPRDGQQQVRSDGTEFWSARDLMPLLGHASWRNFENPIERATKNAENQGMDGEELFRDRGKRLVRGPARTLSCPATPLTWSR